MVKIQETARHAHRGHIQGLGELLLDLGWGPQKWLCGRRLGHLPIALLTRKEQRWRRLNVQSGRREGWEKRKAWPSSSVAVGDRGH